jgi:hypothetical protein
MPLKVGMMDFIWRYWRKSRSYQVVKIKAAPLRKGEVDSNEVRRQMVLKAQTIFKKTIP